MRALCDNGGLRHGRYERQFNTTPKTVAKWVGGIQNRRHNGLRDRRQDLFIADKQRPATWLLEELRRRVHRPPDRASGGTRYLPCHRKPVRGGSALNRISARNRERFAARARKIPARIIHIDIKKLGVSSKTVHRITGDRKGQSNSRGRRLGIRYLAIDDPRGGLLRNPAGRKACSVRFLFNELPASSQPMRQGRIRVMNRQRRQFPIAQLRLRAFVCFKIKQRGPKPIRQRPKRQSRALRQTSLRSGPTIGRTMT